MVHAFSFNLKLHFLYKRLPRALPQHHLSTWAYRVFLESALSAQASILEGICPRQGPTLPVAKLGHQPATRARPPFVPLLNIT